MKVNHKIKIHLDGTRGPMPRIDVMQGDAYTRELEFTLYSGGEAWPVPEGVSVAVAYHGASGHGIYDSLQDDTTKAYAVSGNVVTVTLIPQVAAVKGETKLSVILMGSDNEQLATFCVTLHIMANPAFGAGTPKDYFNICKYIGAGQFRITVQEHNGQWSVDEAMEDILIATNSGRDVCCVVEVGKDRLLLPLIKMTADTLYFSAVCDGTEWLVTIGPNGVHVETKESQSAPVGQEIILADRTSGEVYALFVEDTHLHIEPGGNGTAAHDSVTLIDRTDGGKYVIYVSDGHTMIESEA